MAMARSLVERRMVGLRRDIEVPRPVDEVFGFLDNVRNMGAHMERGGMGVKLQVERLSEHDTGVGATYRWYGKAFGLNVDYTTVVRHWVPNHEKAYETMGRARMIIMSGFRMRWSLVPVVTGTKIAIDLEYGRPDTLVGRFLSRLLGKRYGDWCLNMIMADAVAALSHGPPPHGVLGGAS